MSDFLAAKEFVFSVFEEKLSPKYVFHTLTHTKEVIFFSTKIAEFEKISETDLHLLKTAALYHDTGYLFSNTNHEEYSAEFAKKSLPDFNYNEEEIKKIRKIILSTKENVIPDDILEKIICDADLINLGCESFFRRNRLFRKELENLGQEFSETSWALKTKKFLKSHKFYTEGAKNITKNLKNHNCEMIKKYFEVISN